MQSLVGRGKLMGMAFMAIAGLVGGNVQAAWAQTTTTVTDLPNLPQSEGNANDLAGTFAKDSAIWLGGVGGDGDIEATTTDDNPYEIRADQRDTATASSFSLPPNQDGSVRSRIPLGDF